jgi:hypothetical protein
MGRIDFLSERKKLQQHLGPPLTPLGLEKKGPVLNSASYWARTYQRNPKNHFFLSPDQPSVGERGIPP